MQRKNHCYPVLQVGDSCGCKAGFNIPRLFNGSQFAFVTRNPFYLCVDLSRRHYCRPPDMITHFSSPLNCAVSWSPHWGRLAFGSCSNNSCKLINCYNNSVNNSLLKCFILSRLCIVLYLSGSVYPHHTRYYLPVVPIIWRWKYSGVLCW